MFKSKKRNIFYGIVLIMIVGLVIFVKVKIDQIEQRAQVLAQTGQVTIKLLGEYRQGIENYVTKKDAGLIEASFDDAFEGNPSGAWNEKLVSERDSVRVFEWETTAVSIQNKDLIIGQMKNSLNSIVSIEESKFKLDTVEEIISPEETVTRGFLWLRGTRSKPAGEGEEVFESQAYFRLRLKKIDGQWKINRQELIHGQTVTGERKGFTDITSDSGIDFVSRFNPLFETTEWFPNQI